METSFANPAQHAVIELDALLRDYQLGLVMIAGAGPDTGALPVQWVHSSDLADPTPFLTPRTVLLTTGAQFAGAAVEDEGEVFEEAEMQAYVQRLLDAGTTALGIAIGVQWERIPPPLVAACDRVQLPLFRVPYDTPFIAVVRTAARLLEAAQHAADQLAGEHWGREQAASPSAFGRRRRLAEAEAALRGAVLELLVSGQRELAERVAAKVLPPLPRGSVVVLSYQDPAPQAAAEIASLTVEQPGVLAAGGPTPAGVGGAASITVVIEAERLAALRRVLARHSVAAGVSERGALAELAELVEQAERAAEIARRGAHGGPLGYRPAMHAGVLQLLHGRPEAMRRAEGLLAPLRRHDSRHGDAVEASLAVWLRHNGQTSPAAVELGVHRHTVRARVQTAASLLQRDLDDPDARAELWAALRLAPRAGGAQAPGGSTP